MNRKRIDLGPEAARLALKPRCFMCGLADAVVTTQGHAFPRALFAKPRPSNQPWAWAHEACDNAFSKDETYFRDWVLGQTYAHPEARALWDGPVRRNLARPESAGYRRLITSHMQKIAVWSKGGIFLGEHAAIVAEEPRIEHVLQKIVRVLYTERTGDPLGDVDFSCHFIGPGQTLDAKSLRIFQSLKSNDVGHVRYKFAIAKDEPQSAFCGMWFFQKVFFVVACFPVGTLPPEQQTAKSGLWVQPSIRLDFCTRS